MVKIQAITVGASGASTIDFTSIPQTFTDLKLIASLRVSRPSTDVDGVLIRYNNDTNNANYPQRRLYGNGSSAVSDTNATGNFFATAANNTASVFASCELYIPNYTSSGYKNSNTELANENNTTTNYLGITTFTWNSTSAINRITLSPEGGYPFVQFTSATLYGIKKA